MFEVGRGLPHNIEDEGMLSLLEACALQMRDDYIHGRDYHSPEEERNDRSEYNALVRRSNNLSTFSAEKRKIDAEIRAINRKRIEEWIHGDGGKLLQISDPNALIKYLRKQVRVQETKNMNLMKAVL